jgi:replication factor C subunit 1
VEWIQDWDEVVLEGRKKEAKPKRGSSWADLPKLNARACLLSGPPGIGKTSAARLVTKELGFEAIEFNASDT